MRSIQEAPNCFVGNSKPFDVVAGGSDQDDQEEPGDNDDNVGTLLDWMDGEQLCHWNPSQRISIERNAWEQISMCVSLYSTTLD